MLKGEGGEETRSGYAVYAGEGEGEGSQSTQGRNSSQYVQISLDIQTSHVWQLPWLLLPASLLTILSCGSSPGPDGEKSFS